MTLVLAINDRGTKLSWLDIFLGQITDKIKLVGTSINCWSREPDVRLPGRLYGKMHLQSMFLAMDYMVFGYVRQHLPWYTSHIAFTHFDDFSPRLMSGVVVDEWIVLMDGRFQYSKVRCNLLKRR